MKSYSVNHAADADLITDGEVRTANGVPENVTCMEPYPTSYLRLVACTPQHDSASTCRYFPRAAAMTRRSRRWARVRT